MIDLNLAERLAYLCGDLNDGHGVTIRSKNTDGRIVRDPRLSAHPVILIAGSNDLGDWRDNANCKHVEFGWDLGKVHKGFLASMHRILPQILEAADLDDTVCVAGHSHGGAVATLLAAELVCRGYNVGWVYTMGSPRPASAKFKESYTRLGLRDITFRIVVGEDGVVRCPDRARDRHLGVGHFFGPGGRRLLEQPRPKWYAPWRYLYRSAARHVALTSYATALRRAADGVGL